MEVTKRTLYKEFGKYGYITNVFVSRKSGLNDSGPFAFIRFNTHGGAMRAIRRLNGAYWG
ncbi:hypothetical protein PIB30_075186, partial [Stylosanthes scabra]|nr:hypothetical protein [Stylosanthes scabra]